jgi:hypothetical protein
LQLSFRARMGYFYLTPRRVATICFVAASPSPFWDLDYPALIITDTAFFRNPHCHSPSDTLDALSIDFKAQVCQGIIYAFRGGLT